MSRYQLDCYHLGDPLAHIYCEYPALAAVIARLLREHTKQRREDEPDANGSVYIEVRIAD